MFFGENEITKLMTFNMLNYLFNFRDPKKAIQFACSQNLYIDASMFVPISEGENFEEYCFPKMNQQEVKGFITHVMRKLFCSILMENEKI